LSLVYQWHSQIIEAIYECHWKSFNIVDRDLTKSHWPIGSPKWRFSGVIT
jgi:hypothetical protein